MSKDFKFTLGILAGVGILCALLVVGWLWFLQPYLTLREELSLTEANLAQKQLELRKMHKKKAELEQFRQVSLPANPNLAKNGYHIYLRDMLTRAGMRVKHVPGGKLIPAGK